MLSRLRTLGRSRRTRVAPDDSLSPYTASASSSPELGSASASASVDTDDMIFQNLSNREREQIMRNINREINHLQIEKAKAKKKDPARFDKLSKDIEEQLQHLRVMEAQDDIISQRERAERRVKSKLELRKASAKVAPSGGRRTRKHKKSRTRRRHKKSRKY